MEFGELKEVVLSDVWSDEARDFTPWLADNMDLLSQEIGLPLAWEGTEVPVDGFSADIGSTLRILSGVSERGCNSMVRGSRKFLDISVGSG